MITQSEGRQRELEQRFAQLQGLPTTRNGPHSTEWHQVLAQWIGPLEKYLSEAKEAVAELAEQPKYAHILLRCDPAKTALISLQTTIACCARPQGTSKTNVSVQIGRAVAAQINYQLINKRPTQSVRMRRRVEHKNAQAKIDAILNHTNKAFRSKTDGLARSRRVQFGAFVLNAILHLTRFGGARALVETVESIPSQLGPRQVARLHMHQELARAIGRARISIPGHSPRPPMLVPPRRCADGAPSPYLTHDEDDWIRYKHEEQERLPIPDECAKGFDALCQTRWHINRRIVDLWQHMHEHELVAPGVPSFANVRYSEYNKAMHRRQVFLRRLHASQIVKNEDVFWCPVRADFRGRTYQRSSGLGFQSPDTWRAALEFADGVSLTQAGYSALLVHTASCFGVKGHPSQLKQWTLDVHSQTKKCSRDPIGETWWHDADQPAQFLAACFALHDDEAAARLPVSIDASSNCIQHAAALMRCPETAQQCNLRPGERSDVYANVYEEFQSIEPYRELERKAIKRSIISILMGATVPGVSVDLEDEEGLYHSMRYAGAILESMKRVIPGAMVATDWISHAAYQRAAKGEPANWITPCTGFPVFQPYLTWNDIAETTVIGSLRRIDHDSSAIPDPNRHRIATRANVIQSLDGAHLMRLATRFDKPIGAAHDRYCWHAEHAAEGELLWRETFIEIHKDPFLLELAERWDVEPPELGDWNIEEVRDAVYCLQ